MPSVEVPEVAVHHSEIVELPPKITDSMPSESTRTGSLGHGDTNKIETVEGTQSA